MDIVNGTLEEAMEKLAELAAYYRTGPCEKRAEGGFLSSIGSMVQNNPAISHALIGGGVGALGTGLSTAWNNQGKDPSQKKSVLSSSLLGGLLGAGVGGGIGAARTGISNMKPGGITTQDTLTPGRFTDPVTKQQMSIDPKVLQDHPELPKDIKSLTSSSLQGQISTGIGDVWRGVKSHVPNFASVFPFMAATDLALHAPVVGLARSTPETAGGYYGNKWFNVGVNSSSKLDPTIQQVLHENKPVGEHGGVTTKLPQHTSPGDPTSWLGRMRERLFGKPSKGIRDILGSTYGSATGDEPVLETAQPRTKKVTQVDNPLMEGERGPVPDKSVSQTSEVTKPVYDEHGNPIIDRKQLSRGTVGMLKGEGAKLDPDFAGRSVMRIPGTNRIYRGAATLGGAALARLGIYGAPMAADYVYTGLKEDSKKQQAMRDIIARYAKPVE